MAEPTTGQFTGEATMISGRRALFLIRAREDSEVLELTRDAVAALVQNDAELSEILIRAFVLRRVELITANVGDTAIVGSSHSADTLRVKEFLTRNGPTPTSMSSATRRQVLLDRFHFGVGRPGPDPPPRGGPQESEQRGGGALSRPTTRSIARTSAISS